MSRQKTYIIMGRYRGGTSMLTQMVDAAGIYVGEKHHGNWEDPDFVPSSMGGKLKALPETVTKIRDRNEKYEQWGFKFPGSHKYLKELLPWFRNPEVLVIYRDAQAIANSERRRAGIDVPTISILEHYMHLERLFFDLQQEGVKIHKFSYEKAMTKTTEFCGELAQILDTEKSKLLPIIGNYDNYGRKDWEY